jgi:putative intracellular protease/amidase
LRFKSDPAAQAALANTVKLTEVKAEDFDTVFYPVFYPGGHGPLWDLAEDANSIALIEGFYNSGKPVAAVCHGPAVLRRARANGAPIVKGKRVTAFTDTEEEAVHLSNVVPFRVEEELKRLGGHFERAADWQSLAVVDGRLVTGQNPASSAAAARELVKLLS